MYDFTIVDEAQDIGIAELRFVAALAGNRPNGLFFTGDIGQRIFQQPFSWRALGVDLRGRSDVLRVNYRTSQQIRRQADQLLGPVVTDSDAPFLKRAGITGARQPSTVQVSNGTSPGVAHNRGPYLCQELDEGCSPALIRRPS